MNVPEKPTELAIAGWRSKSARLVVAALFIEALTGLWIYLAPFSVAAQIQLLVHTLIGVALLVPCVQYLISHFLQWYRQKMSVAMVLGYGLAVVVLTCVVSGVVVTWQAAIETRMSVGWDLVHLVSGIAIVALLPTHLVVAFLRRRPAAVRNPAFVPAIRGFVLWQGLSVVGVAAVVTVVALAWPVTRVQTPAPEGYTLSSYVDQYDEYRANLFAPSYARTESGMMIDPAVLSGSESCGSSGCHEQILAEWQPSAHRFSAMNPPFQTVQKNFAADREPAETRYCAGCHDPISLFAGAKDIQNQDLAAPGMQEGTSCVVCHSVSKVDQRGNADYVISPPTKYIWEGTDGARKFVSDFLIRAYPRQHLADYDRNILRTPEFCAACHKQFIPEALTRFGLTPGQNQYDEWRKSHWHADDPETDLTCRDCHMRLVSDSRDPGRGEAGDVRRSPDDGAHRHHGTIGTNMFMPEVMKLPHWKEQVRLTEEWIRGETVLKEIEHLWPAGPLVSFQVLAPKQVEAGQEARLKIVIGNQKVGHNYITGPLDFMRAWVHLEVLDASGATIAEWGNIDPESRRICDTPGQPHETGNSRKEGTLVLEGLPLDEKGQPLVRHELWKKAGGKGQRVIFPRYSDSHEYRFRVPDGATGSLQVKARLCFRRYRQEFLDLVVPDMEKDTGVYQPTVVQASCRKEIPVAPAGGGGK